jgi:quercetin dioxygenase-like cupin family protein
MPGTVTREALLTATLGHDASFERVEIKRIRLSPGQETGFHLHPCPVVGYIASGAIHFQIEGQAARRLNAGDAFYEPKGVRIAHFDNPSASEPATFIAFYLLEAGKSELIEMLEPS